MQVRLSHKDSAASGVGNSYSVSFSSTEESYYFEVAHHQILSVEL